MHSYLPNALTATLALALCVTLLAPGIALPAIGPGNTPGPAPSPSLASGSSPSHGRMAPVASADLPASWSAASGRPSPGTPQDSLRTIPLGAPNGAASAGDPAWLAFDAADDSFWVASPPSSVQVLHVTGSLQWNVTATYTVGTDPFGVAVDNATGDVYVTNPGSDNVTVINDALGTTVANIDVGVRPYGVTYDPVSQEVFVANGGSDNVTVISGATRTVVGAVDVGSSPVGLVADPSTERLFVADNGSSNVTVIGIPTRSVVATVPVGLHPYGAALDSATDQVFVTNSGSNNISVLDAGTASPVASIPVALGVNLQGIAYDPVRQLMWVGGGSFYAVVVNATSQSVIGYMATDPSGAAVDPATGVACLTNTANMTLACIAYPELLFPSVDVTFAETGLPTLTNWTVVLHWPGFHRSNSTSASSQIDFRVFSGPPSTYYYAVPPLSGYVAEASGGYLSLGASSVQVNVTFVPMSSTYPVTFTEVGLSAGTTWGVALEGAVNRSNTSTVGFREPNGSYGFSLEPVPGYSGSPSVGGLLVSGAGVTVLIDFVALPPPAANATVTFSESGLPPLTSWVVAVNGTFRSTTSSSLRFTLPPGTYTYEVYPVLGFLPVPPSYGEFVLGSSNLTIPIVFVPVYWLIFQETGLPTGTNWSVTLDGVLEWSTSAELPLALGAWDHNYSVGAVAGYTASPSNGSITLARNTTVAVVFTPNVPPATTYLVTFIEVGLVTGTPWCVLLNTSDACSDGATVTIAKPNGTYAFLVGSVPGMVAYPASGTVLVQGTDVNRSVTFLPIPPVTSVTSGGVAPTTLVLLAAIAATAGAAAGLVGGILVARRRPPGP